MSKLLYLLPFAFFLVLIPHLSFTPWPEMLSRPFLITNGWLPYKDIIMEHSPFLLYILAVWFKYFGLGIIQLKWFTASVIFLNTSLILYYLKGRISLITGVTSGFFYLLLCVAFDGNGIWFDLALTPFILLVFLLLDAKKYFSAGLLFALSFFVKQSALWFIFPIIFSIPVSKKNILNFITGAGLVSALILLFFFTQGFLSDFFTRAFVYPATVQWPTSYQLIYFSPFILLLFPFIPKKIKLWILFGVLGVFPRWGLFHFQPALPFLAILFGYYLSLPNHRISKLIYLSLFSLFVFRQLNQVWHTPDRFSEPEFIQTIEYVRNNTQNSDLILVLNTWESLYALSDRLPAVKPLYPFLPWYLDQPGVQDRIVSGIAKHPASLIIQGQLQTQGLGSFNPVVLYQYLSQNYRQTVKIGSINVLQH